MGLLRVIKRVITSPVCSYQVFYRHMSYVICFYLLLNHLWLNYLFTSKLQKCFRSTRFFSFSRKLISGDRSDIDHNVNGRQCQSPDADGQSATLLFNVKILLLLFFFWLQVACNRRLASQPPSACVLEVSVKGVKISVQDQCQSAHRVCAQLSCTLLPSWPLQTQSPVHAELKGWQWCVDPA